MDLVNKIEKAREEINKMNQKLDKLETEFYYENKKIVKNCQHKKVYKYILEKQVIYICKKCRNNLQEEEIKESMIKIRSFI